MSQGNPARSAAPRCYRVIVKLKSRGGEIPDRSMTFETLAASSVEAEEKVMAERHREWETHYLFDGIQAAFPCEDEPA
ncbi:MAG TPA: hypothetical protein VLW45_04035 [Pelomicrobium sp.]|nr:hypothetical protein [Pelomicrobium sp.]